MTATPALAPDWRSLAGTVQYPTDLLIDGDAQRGQLRGLTLASGEQIGWLLLAHGVLTGKQAGKFVVAIGVRASGRQNIPVRIDQLQRYLGQSFVSSGRIKQAVAIGIGVHIA